MKVAQKNILTSKLCTFKLETSVFSMAYNLYCNQNSQANSAQLFISREKWIFDFNIYILRITAVFGFMYVVGELLEDQLLQKIVCLFIYVLRDRHRLLLHLLNSFHRYIFGHAGPNSSPTLQKCTCYISKIKVMNVVSKCQKKAIFCNFCDRHFIQNCAFQRQTDQRFCI